MGVITVTVNPVPVIVQFNTLPGAELQVTGVPRALIRFDTNFSTPVTGSGDQGDLIINVDLPPNYYYRMLSIQLNLNGDGDDIQDWIDSEAARISFETNAFFTYFTPMRWETYTVKWGNLPSEEGATARPQVQDRVIDQLIDGRTERGINPRLKIESHMNDQNVEALAGNIFATFLQYDIAQGLDWPLYYPGNALG